MKLKGAAWLVLLSLLPIIAVAQDQAPKPATKMEAFQVKTGVVVVRGYTTVGKVSTTSGEVTVDAREFRDAGGGAARITGISIGVKETSRLARDNTSYIDADEIDSLLQGLDYIAKATRTVTAHQNFEVEYRTKGDFSVTVFSDSRGELSAAVSSGRIGKTSVFMALAQLAQLRSLIVDAKGKL